MNRLGKHRLEPIARTPVRLNWIDFDGTKFRRPVRLDFEHKRVFPGDLGEMTGEMGTLATYQGAEPLFAATLARVAPVFAAHRPVGCVNRNLIVGDGGTPWPLEFTSRFGNTGFAVLAAFQRDGWGDLFARMARGGGGQLRARPRLPGRPRAPHAAVPRLGARRAGGGRAVFLANDLPPGNLHWADVRRDPAGQL